nr:MAG TPA: hypothetical protein [Caudoviricetes sp.]
MQFSFVLLLTSTTSASLSGSRNVPPAWRQGQRGD